MVGTGIFTSLGFQVGDLPSGFAIMALWAVGGVCALCGALSYAELGAALPRSGGEYHFLREIYHPAVGFVAGWISATVGFAAPVAIAAIPFGTYVAGVVPGLNPLFLSLAVIWITTLVLLWDLRLGSGFQNVSTLLKVGLILLIIAAGFYVKETQADLVSAGENGSGAHRKHAIRDQSLLGDVCLFGVERLDLYRRRSAQSGTHHSALARRSARCSSPPSTSELTRSFCARLRWRR